MAVQRRQFAAATGIISRSVVARQSLFMKVKEAIALIEQDGWYIVRTRGSHRQFKHDAKPGLVTVPGKPSDDLAPGTANSILKQAGLKP